MSTYYDFKTIKRIILTLVDYFEIIAVGQTKGDLGTQS